MGDILTPAQTHIQNQLQRKHEHLQHLIVQQQEELRIVSEQLLMTRYGVLPPIVNVCYPSTSSAAISTDQSGRHEGNIEQQQHLQTQQSHSGYVQRLQMHNVNQHPTVVNHNHQQGQDNHYLSQQQDMEQSVPQEQGGVAGVDGEGSNTSDMISYVIASEQAGDQQQLQSQQPNRLEMIPYQLTQQQAHALFGSNMSTHQTNSNHGEG